MKDEASKGIRQIGLETEKTGQKVEKGQGIFGKFGGVLKGTVGNIGGLIGVLGPAGFGISKMTDFLGDAAQAAREEQMQVQKLSATLRSNVPSWNGNIDAIESYISAQEKATAFQDGELRASFEALAFRTHDIALSQQAMAASADLARQKNIPLAQATEMVGKALDGQLGPLKKTGIEIAKNSDAGQILTQIQNQMGDAAENYANSAAGAAARSANTWENVKETIGGALTPLLDFGGQVVLFLTERLGAAVGEVQKHLQPFIDGIQTLTRAFGQAVSGDGAALMQFFRDLGGPFEAIGTFLTNIISNFRTFFDTLSSGGDPIQAFITLVGDNLGALGNLIGGVGQWFLNALPGIVSALGEWAGTVLRFVGDNAPIWAAKFGELAGSTWSWLIDNIPTWLQKAGEFLGATLQWVAESAPKFAEAMWAWGSGLWSWIEPQIPIWQEKAGQFLSEIGRWAVIGMVQLTEMMGPWVHAFGSWLLTAIENTKNKLGEWLIWFGGWAVTVALPAIATAVGGWVLAYASWVYDSIPLLFTALGEYINQLGRWMLSTALPGLVQNAKQWAQALVTWVNEAWIGLTTELANFWNGLKNWIGTTAAAIKVEAGKIALGLVQGFVDGINSNMGLIPAHLRPMFQLAIDTAKNTLEEKSPSRVFYGIGENVVRGFANGIALATHIATAAARAMAVAAAAAAREALDISSPSGEFIKIGQDTVAGFQVGVLSDWPAAEAMLVQRIGALSDADMKGIANIGGSTLALQTVNGWKATMAADWPQAHAVLADRLRALSGADMQGATHAGGQVLGGSLVQGVMDQIVADWVQLQHDLLWLASEGGKAAAAAYMENLNNGVKVGPYDGTQKSAQNNSEGSYPYGDNNGGADRDSGGAAGGRAQYTAATGFEGFISRPSTFHVAEPGTGGEYVSVIPRGQMGRGGAGGGLTINNLIIKANSYEEGQEASRGFWDGIRNLEANISENMNLRGRYATSG